MRTVIPNRRGTRKCQSRRRRRHVRSQRFPRLLCQQIGARDATRRDGNGQVLAKIKRQKKKDRIVSKLFFC